MVGPDHESSGSSTARSSAAEQSVDQHDHCSCVEPPNREIENLPDEWKKECEASAKLRLELDERKQRLDFCLDRFKEDTAIHSPLRNVSKKLPWPMVLTSWHLS